MKRIIPASSATASVTTAIRSAVRPGGRRRPATARCRARRSRRRPRSQGPVRELDRPVGPRGDVRVVRGDDASRSRTSPATASIRSSTRRPVSESRWPVGSSQSSSSGSLGERPGDRDPLLLAPESSAGSARALALEADQRQVVVRGLGRAAAVALGSRRRRTAAPGGHDREGDVLAGVQVGQQVRPLEDVGDRPARDPRPRAARSRLASSSPRHATVPEVGSDQAAEDVQQGGLARPGGAEQPHALAVDDLEVDARQGRARRPPRGRGRPSRRGS